MILSRRASRWLAGTCAHTPNSPIAHAASSPGAGPNATPRSASPESTVLKTLNDAASRTVTFSASSPRVARYGAMTSATVTWGATTVETDAPGRQGLAHRGHGRVRARDEVARVGEEPPPGRRQAESPTRPVEEAEPEILLEAAELPGERRLRDAHGRGRARDRALVHHGEEVADHSQLHRSTYPLISHACRGMTPPPRSIGRLSALGQDSAVQGRVGGGGGRRGGRVRRGSPIMRRDPGRELVAFRAAAQRAGLRSVAAMAAGRGHRRRPHPAPRRPRHRRRHRRSRARRPPPRARRPRRRRLPPRRRPRVVRNRAQRRSDGQPHHLGSHQVLLHRSALHGQLLRAAAAGQPARRRGEVRARAGRILGIQRRRPDLDLSNCAPT